MSKTDKRHNGTSKHARKAPATPNWCEEFVAMERGLFSPIRMPTDAQRAEAAKRAGTYTAMPNTAYWAELEKIVLDEIPLEQMSEAELCKVLCGMCAERKRMFGCFYGCLLLTGAKIAQRHAMRQTEPR